MFAEESLRAALPSDLQQRDLKMYVADLEPGDVLAMPSGWLHYVQALSPSVSVNVWTDSAETTDLGLILANPLPWYSPADPKEYTLGAVTRLLREVVEQVDKPIFKTREGFVHALVQQRYDAVFPQAVEKAACGAAVEASEALVAHEAQMASLFNEFSPETRELYLQTWLELLAERAVGAEHVRDYIESCFRD